MAITISGENNNDRILAQDGVIDEISGINIVGLLTAGHINVGSNINLGNAGIITATTFIGNLTGNVKIESDGELYVSYYNTSGAASTSGYYSGFAKPPKLDLNLSLSFWLPPT